MATRAEAIHALLTADDDGRVCLDIPEEACREQPRNFLTHVASLAATKTGDGLADPKLVLAWLFAALGVPEAFVGLLVPVREAGALVPQLVIAGTIRSVPRRKWVWAAGSLVQGLAVAGMGAAALALRGAALGAAVVGLLAVFALARSVCSVSYKDVLGKTVSKSTRGTATGSASTVSAALVLAFGLSLSAGLLPLSVATIAGALAVAGALWVVAALLFSTLAEEPGSTGGGGRPLSVAAGQLSLLREDPQLLLFIATRALLVATALAPPYILTLAGRSSETRLGSLGPFVAASSIAALTSTYVWGRFADRSSRKVLAAAGLVASVALALAALAGALGGGATLPRWTSPALLLVLMVAYQGVRLGRSTHVVDMATEATRAAYTALSNTAIGLVLVAASGFGVLAQLAGEAAVLAVFAAMCAAAALAALSLREVQRRED